MKKLDKALLEEEYLTHLRTPTEIAARLGCDHKTVRKYLRMHGIPLRTAAEYNYLARKSHESPSPEVLKSPVSLMAHTAYLCEGWHTERTSSLYFCNTDPLLLDLFIRCLTTTYKVNSYRTVIFARSEEEASPLIIKYPRSKFYVDPERKTPIVRVICGGKTLASEFVSNAYSLLPLSSKE